MHKFPNILDTERPRGYNSNEAQGRLSCVRVPWVQNRYIERPMPRLSNECIKRACKYMYQATYTYYRINIRYNTGSIYVVVL